MVSSLAFERLALSVYFVCMRVSISGRCAGHVVVMRDICAGHAVVMRDICTPAFGSGHATCISRTCLSRSCLQPSVRLPERLRESARLSSEYWSVAS